MSEHALLSPSGSERWIACPGSIELSKSAPPEPFSKAATEGTDAHEWASKILLGGSPENCPYADIDMYVKRVSEAASRKGAFLWVEQRVYLNDVIHGTPDAVVYCKNTLEVFDLKYGYNKVEAVGNTQLIIYAAGAIATYELKPKTIKLHIVQPRAGGVRTSVMPIKLFNAAVNRILAQSDFALSPYAPRRAGAHCQYCKAAPICPERKEEAKRASEIAFREIQSLDEDTLIWAIENKKRIIEWFELLTEHAIQKPPRGYLAVQGQGKRVWRTDIEIPMVLKVMTLAEAEKAGHNLDELTIKRPGPMTLAKKDTSPEAFPNL